MARPKLIPILFIGFALFQSLVLQLNGLPINSSIKQRRAEKIASPSMIPSLVATQVYSSSMFEHWVPKKTGNKETIPSSSANWIYENPATWPSIYSTCGGDKQSPIDIEPRTSFQKNYPKFTFNNYGDIDNMEVVNNGHTVLFILPSEYPRIPSISGGGLNETYIFQQFHLHWGSDSSKGSEHRIKSKGYAAELHLVHYNTKYGSFAEAIHHSDGLAVLGVLIDISREDNEALRPLVDQLNELNEENHHETTLTSLVPFYSLLPKDTSSFFRYGGSLTSPICGEIVLWTVFNNPIFMSEKQLSKFRTLHKEDGGDLVNNFRPPLPLNSRQITFRSFSSCELSESEHFSSSPLLQIILWGQCYMESAVRSVFSF